MRVNISIPDALHERVERVRERLNVSKVCTRALEREVDMIEARPSMIDPTIAQLVERLKGSTQRWYDHGHEDGTRWGTEKAKRSELEDAAYACRPYDGRELSSAYFELPEHATGEEGEEAADTTHVPALPGIRDLRQQEKVWVLRDLGLDKEPSWGGDAYARFNAAYDAVDDAAYLEGWRDALVELWDAVAPALRG